MSSDAWKFLSAFLSRPGQVGAILPSSQALARCMTNGVDWSTAQTVIEFGPGTGPFTCEILQRAAPHTRILAIEINGEFAQGLQQRFPQVAVHHASVAEAPAICAAAGIDHVDAILSGLPWAVFPPEDQRTFLNAAAQVLRADGQFVTFAYLQGLLLPAAKRFRKLLEQTFATVETSPIVWTNFPPALAYYCRKASAT